MIPTKTRRDKDYDKAEMERKHKHRPRRDDERSDFEIDRSRIIHSTAFRRLQGKTQVFGLTTSDFFRTRLTHSLETAQIGKGIALRVGANPELVEAASLAHDIGHPPFGHTVEKILAEMMNGHGGFAANAQNIRVLERLEVKVEDYRGLNLTRATWDAILKYKRPFSEVKDKEMEKHIKCYYDGDRDIVEWASEGAPSTDARSLECWIVDWADDIAYSTHDLEDGIKSGMINLATLKRPSIKKALKDAWERDGGKWNETDWDWSLEIIQKASEPRPSYREYKANRKEVISGIIGEFIQAASLGRVDGANLPSRYRYSLKVRPEWKQRAEMLKKIVYYTIIRDERITTLERKACHLVTEIFNEFTDWERDPHLLLPDDFREMCTGDVTEEHYRVVCDYISGMTDRHLSRIYSRIKEAEAGSLFDIL